MFNYWFLWIVVLLVFGSCKKVSNNNVVSDLGYEYFPLRLNAISIFNVDSIAFNDNTKTTDTFNFQIKWQTDTVYNAQNGNKVFVINQFVKDSVNNTWLSTQNIFVETNNSQLIIKQNNTSVVKLIFPLGNTKSWNGNMYNTLPRKTFLLTYFNEPKDSLLTCRVQESNSINAIEEDVSYAVYAKNIGLISYYNKNLNKQADGTSGYIINYTLISYE